MFHGNLKTSNILLLINADVKLTDFALFKHNPEGINNYCYLPPEFASKGELTCQSDLWALGCVIYELSTGQQPY